MLGINTNTSSLIAQKNLNKNMMGLENSINRLSSGLRINSAKDDAAGLAIADKMSSQIRGLQQANRNANDGLSYMEIADSSLSKINDNLQRMRELAVQSSNGTLNTTDRDNLNREYSQLASEVERVTTSAEFNGNTILDQQSIDLQVGADQGDTLTVALTANGDPSGANMNATLGGNGTAGSIAANFGDITDITNANTAIGTLDTAIQDVNSVRATVGAGMSRLEQVVSSNESLITGTSSARGRIMDADFAKETANLTRVQILQQAGTAMLAQANQLPQNVLSLLR